MVVEGGGPWIWYQVLVSESTFGMWKGTEPSMARWEVMAGGTSAADEVKEGNERKTWKRWRKVGKL